jgi:hypothetical protein
MRLVDLIAQLEVARDDIAANLGETAVAAADVRLAMPARLEIRG